MTDELPNLTKTMFESYKIWSSENFDNTLKNQKSDLENLLTVLDVLDIWSSTLFDIEPAQTMMPELYFDAYMSIHFACIGLYKYAYSCLRSQLETMLRLVYFSTHPTEYQWWLSGNEWYKKGLSTKDVWGDGYNYFANMELIKKFDSECDDSRKLFSSGGNIRRIYSKLSKYVHSSVRSFQTKAERFSPTYDFEIFKRWETTFTKIQNFVNILFILGFNEQFLKINPNDQTRILDEGIQSDFYRPIILKLIGKGED